MVKMNRATAESEDTRPVESDKWYNPRVVTGWKKGDSINIRRNRVIDAYGGDYLAAARSMQALANVTTDSVTRREARRDAKYFYRINNERKHSGSGRVLRISPKMPRLR